MAECGQLAQVRTDQETVRYMLQWHVTHRCNLRCEHCYQDTYHGHGLPLDGLLGILGQFRDFIEAHRAAGDPAARGYITVTGGEPFARRDFLELLRVFTAHRDLLSYSVLTNGTLLKEPLVAELARLQPGYVQVSIDGVRETHDRIRGAGMFDRAVAGIRLLVAAGVRTMIAFTAHRGNYREFPAIAALGRELRVARVWADRLIPEGAGTDLERELLSPVETAEFCRLMATVRDAANADPDTTTEIALHRALQFLVGDGHPYHCTAGDTLFTIMPNGDLYPCRRMPVRVGNVLEQPLAELYDCGLFRSLRDPVRVSAGCGSCGHSGTCRGGLKCLSYALTGDPFQADPGCWQADRGERPLLPLART